MRDEEEEGGVESSFPDCGWVSSLAVDRWSWRGERMKECVVSK